MELSAYSFCGIVVPDNKNILIVLKTIMYSIFIFYECTVEFTFCIE